jgi:hypothetical protein
MPTLEQVQELSHEKRILAQIVARGGGLWLPVTKPVGPQYQAFISEADELFYGGAAGGGKTDLLCGLSLIAHKNALLLRRQAVNLKPIEDRLRLLIPDDLGKYNSVENVWTFKGLKGKRIRMGGMKYETDWRSYAGGNYDLIGLDELPDFSESQYRTIQIWNRSQDWPRVRVVATGNPPTDSDGEWVIHYWAPWLDENHPNPARPGELRWFISTDEGDVEVPNKEPVEVDGRLLSPRSRTFIPAKVQDNPHFMKQGYDKQLEALDPELREKYLHGKFTTISQDNPSQVIPKPWVKAAMDRWEAFVKTHGRPSVPMTALGVDVARGGKDKTTIAKRYGNFYDHLLIYPGHMTPDGPSVAGLVIDALEDDASVNIDVIGVGSSAYDSLVDLGISVYPLNSAERDPDARDRSGKFAFRNNRAKWWWLFKEALDPEFGEGIMLPPSPSLMAELCTVRRKSITASGILLESKEEIDKRIHRSTNEADAVIYAWAEGSIVRDARVLDI